MEAQPSIYIWGILVEEPVTTVTDLFITIVCFYAFYRLVRIPNKNRVHIYLKVYFLSMGIATAIGGLIGHGFFYAFDKNMYWKLPGWITSMISIAMIERASIGYARKLIKPKVVKVFKWINIIELVTFIIITFVTTNFFFVEVHSAYGLLVVVAGFNIFIYLKTKSIGSRHYLIAVFLSAISALIFMNEIGINKWLNHYDISHIVMTLSAWYFYRGSMYAINDDLVN